jgi:hypothetical protein
MSMRVNPYSGELEITGMREEEGRFPVLPGMFLSWILMGILNFITGKILGWLGFKTNPLELKFHYGYALREDSPPVGYKGNDNGKRYINNNWEKEMSEELYRFD